MIAVIAISGCTPAAEAADPAKIEQALKTQESQWQDAYKSKNMEALAGAYTEDAAIAGPGEALATTEVERRKAIQAMTSDPNFALTFSSDRILVAKSGDMASTRGHYTLQLTDKATNKPVMNSGSYLTVFRKQDDGSWKAVEDFITPGPAPAAS
jgi:ketosteroid isomerase-like protein